MRGNVLNLAITVHHRRSIWRRSDILSTVIQNYGDVFPSSQRRGGRDLNKISRSLLISERTGWSDRRNHLGRTDHPVCAASVASQHLLDGASTPPLRGGEWPPNPYVSVIPKTSTT